MEMEDEKRSLIHREIDKFRDTYKVRLKSAISQSLGHTFVQIAVERVVIRFESDSRFSDKERIINFS